MRITSLKSETVERSGAVGEAIAGRRLGSLPLNRVMSEEEEQQPSLVKWPHLPAPAGSWISTAAVLPSSLAININ
ncbi:hypothetical protein SDJN02_22163, partial [Cucurbita argyrosperma subsp. argyrosperma]